MLMTSTPWAMGTHEFHGKVTDKIQETYVFGKVENHKYRFTGVDIKETSEGIEVNQKTYCDSLQEIKIENGKNNNRPLTRQEYKKFRKLLENSTGCRRAPDLT